MSKDFSDLLKKKPSFSIDLFCNTKEGLLSKVLFLIIFLVIFSNVSNAQNTNCKITKKGCGKIKIGLSQKKIEKILGKPDKEEVFFSHITNDDLLFTSFYLKGIQVIYGKSTKTVHYVYFYNDDSSAKNFAVFQNAKTSKDINWRSTPDDIIKAYGKPKDDFNGTEYNENWRRIVYPRMDFRFENKTLVRIGVFVKEKKEKVEPI